jgi:hypothetical protein
MTKVTKQERVEEIKEMVQAFCRKYLDEDLAGYSLKLCDTLGRKRTLDIGRGRKEIWAAAVIYVIARLNFLFDKANDYYVTANVICDYFGTTKSSTANKATTIEKACGLGLGAAGYCSRSISDMLNFVELPNGMIIPKDMLPKLEIIIEEADEEESAEIEQFAAERRRRDALNREAAKVRRAEINRKIAKERKKKKQEKQLRLFD